MALSPTTSRVATSGASLTVISDQTLAADATTIDFPSIASAYAHLRILIIGRCTGAVTSAPVLARFNNDSGANYSVEIAQGNNVTASAVNATGQTSAQFGNVTGASAAAGIVSGAEGVIPNYAGTTFQKMILAVTGARGGTTAGLHYVQAMAAYWADTSAITRLTLLTTSGDFLAGTRATLYGMT